MRHRPDYGDATPGDLARALRLPKAERKTTARSQQSDRGTSAASRPAPRRPSSSKPKPRTVEVLHPSYQPSKAELEADLRVNATFHEAMDALTQPVQIRYIDRPKPAP